MKTITTDEARKIIGCSINTLIMFKKQCGKNNVKLTVEDLPQFKAMHDEWVKTKAERRNGLGHLKHYNKAMIILNNDGFITHKKLLSIFKTGNVANIQSFFEQQGEPIYRDTLQKVVVYRSFNVFKQQMREENNAYGSDKLPKNGPTIITKRRLF